MAIHLLTLNLRDKSGRCQKVQIDLFRLQSISSSPSLANWLAPALSVDISDVWRYTLVVARDNKFEIVPLAQGSESKKEKKLRFIDRPAEEAIRERQPIVLLLLESPHTEEYQQETPGQGKPLTAIGPAQGRTGKGIDKHLLKVLDKVLRKVPLAPDNYSLVIANPIPYHCSLGRLADMQQDKSGKMRRPGLNEEVRNYIWKTLWSQVYIKNDFEARCNKYKPVIILNCCTQFVEAKDDSITLQHLVTEFLWCHGFRGGIWEAGHPSSWEKTINRGHNIRVEQVTPRKMQNRLKNRESCQTNDL